MKGAKFMLDQLIAATGADTFEQALAFVREQREIVDMADRACVPKPNAAESDRMFNEGMLKHIHKTIGDDAFRSLLNKLQLP